jgi:hypothetical protein
MGKAMKEKITYWIVKSKAQLVLDVVIRSTSLCASIASLKLLEYEISLSLNHADSKWQDNFTMY